MGVSFIDNGPSFKLEGGSVNDGYLAKDGIHLTAAGTNRFVRNLKHAMADGLLTAVCSFDISKCFDTINY